MVAAASRPGDLSVAAAWTVFALTVAGFMAGAAISDRTMLRDVSEMKAPDALRERARQILAQAGLRERPGDSDLFVVYGPAFVYRQSRSALQPFNARGTLQTFDPPLDVVRGTITRNSGMATVQLYPDGRLLRFLIVPPAMEKGTAADPNWDPFLIAAGYDPRRV